MSPDHEAEQAKTAELSAQAHKLTKDIIRLADRSVIRLDDVKEFQEVYPETEAAAAYCFGTIYGFWADEGGTQDDLRLIIMLALRHNFNYPPTDEREMCERLFKCLADEDYDPQISEIIKMGMEGYHLLWRGERSEVKSAIAEAIRIIRGEVQNDIWSAYLKKINAHKAEKGEKLNEGIGEKALELLNENIKRQMYSALPEEYSVMLKRVNGLEHNGCRFYGADDDLEDTEPENHAGGLLEMNSYWHRNIRLRLYLILGESGSALYAYKFSDSKYYKLDLESCQVQEIYLMFSDMFTHMLAGSM